MVTLSSGESTERQIERRWELRSLLGDLPPPSGSVASTLISTGRGPNYTLERLVLDLNGVDPVPAYFLRPVDADPRARLPVVLYNHASGDDMVLGKDELLNGRAALKSPPYGEALAAEGYAVLCIDMWGFGERRGRTLSELFKDMLWHGQVLWGMMVFDSLRAVDYLISRDDVDAQRIGTLGMSSGSTMAWWTAALDTRVQVCVDICCLTDYQALIRSGGLDGHGVYYYVPSLLKHFSTADINELIAPRPHLALAGIYDPLTPADGLDTVDRELRAVYEGMGASSAWRLSRYNCGHFETEAMRAEALAFLRERL